MSYLISMTVEVHQVSGSSSDISFAMALEARKSQVENAIVLTQDTVVKSRVMEKGLRRGVNEASFWVVGP